MRIYATLEDLAQWGVTDWPTDPLGLLREASGLVEDASRGALYVTDADGMPVDADILEAFRDATCAHAAAMAENKIKPNSGGVITAGKTVASQSIPGSSISFAGAQEAVNGLVTLVSGASLSAQAWGILRRAGLTQPVIVPAGRYRV